MIFITFPLAVDCGVLNDPSNGYIQYSATTFNHRAYYHCYNGYKRVGSFSRRCASTGVWTEEEPICQCKLVYTCSYIPTKAPKHLYNNYNG